MCWWEGGGGGAASKGLNLEVHIPETSSLQMSCAFALVAVMGKLHGEEGHTQLESGKSLGGGWAGGGKWEGADASGAHAGKVEESRDEEAGPTGHGVI